MINIVIVEDELIAAEYLKELLHANGFQVIEILDKGKEAIQRIPQLNPDIVLMDIMLKDNVSGSEVALYLKQRTPHIAIVFLTAYAENEMIEYAIESNTYGYLMKPYDDVRIITSLKIILARIEKDKDKKDTQISPLSVQINNEVIFDRSIKRLFKNSQEISLGIKSIALLEILCKQPNVTVSTEHLCMKIWGESKNASMLRTQVSRTKKEMGIDVIVNSKGLGYKIVCTS